MTEAVETWVRFFNSFSSGKASNHLVVMLITPSYGLSLPLLLPLVVPTGETTTNADFVKFCKFVNKFIPIDCFLSVSAEVGNPIQSGELSLGKLSIHCSIAYIQLISVYTLFSLYMILISSTAHIHNIYSSSYLSTQSLWQN